MLKAIYNILVCFAVPLATCVAWVRGLRDPARRERLADRFGYPKLSLKLYPKLPPELLAASPSIWLHAASMGEVQAGASLVKRLLAAYPQYHIVVTTMTTTGAARVRALFGERVAHCFLPYDVPFAVNAFLDRARPQVAVILETELWPNLLNACRIRRIPLLISSARISPRTAKRYLRLKGLFNEALADTTIFAQTALDAERFNSLGATKASIGGNLKFDIEVDPDIHQRADELRSMFAQRPCWVAGSTHEGEEIAALQAHKALLKIQPNAMLILVPRHPQRFATVEKFLQADNVDYVTRSSGKSPVSAAVWLFDTVGELMNCYAASDVAFVGGSLVPVGGHNLLEPAALGRPIVCGPFNANGQEIFDLFSEQAALYCVSNVDELCRIVIELMSMESTRNQLGLRGQQMLANNGGALARTLQWIDAHVSKG